MLKRFLATSAVMVVAAGCAPSLDTERTSVDQGTFGQTLVTLACKRLAYQADLADGGPVDVRGDRYRDTCRGGAAPADAPATIKALLGGRDRLAKAIDAAMPKAFLDTLQAYLTGHDVLALYDDDTLGNALASLASVLDDVGHDDAALAAFGRAAARSGYRPPATAIGVPGALVSVPGMDGVLDKVLAAITAGGVAHAEWDALVAALAPTLADASAPADAAAPDRTAMLARALLLTERSDLGDPTALPLVVRDRRGLAQVALVGGQVPAPFVDADHDLLADVDAQGRFIDGSGAPAAVPTPFPSAGSPAGPRDAAGRALASAGGAPLYVYVDVTRTPLGALGHDVAALFDPTKGTVLNLTRGASALMGPRVTTTHDFSGSTLSYRGYDTTQSPMLDIIYGFIQLLRDPNIRDLLGLTDTLLASHAPAAARLAEALITAARAGDAHPEATIPANAPMWDDALVVVRQIIARPALVRSLLQALEVPATKLLAKRFANYMTYADVWDYDGSGNLRGQFATPVDRTHPDSALNQSLMQRLLYLIAASNHVQFCNKDGATLSIGPLTYPLIGSYTQCELVQIDNLATFFVLSIAYAKDGAGNVLCEDSSGASTSCGAADSRPQPAANMVLKSSVVNFALDQLLGDSFLESQSGITGFRRHPTPPALARVLFLSPQPAFLQTIIAPATDADGKLYTAAHAGTLPVWEADNFYDQIRPIVQAFVDDGSEQLFVDLLSALHKHWPSKDSVTFQTTNPAGPAYVWGSGAERYEPLIADVLATDLLPALVDTAPELDAMIVNGKSYPTILTNTASFFLTPLPGLADRQHRTSTTTADGRPVPVLSPWHLLADAYRGKTARLATVGADGQAWKDGVAQVIDVLLRAANNGGGWTFRNGHAVPVTRAVVAFLRARLDAHAAKGDVATWLGATLPTDAHDLLTHPLLAGVADLTAAISAEPATRAALDGLVHDAFEEVTSPASFATMQVASADLLQLAADDNEVVPIAHLAGALLAPAKGYLPIQLGLTRKLRAADTTHALLSLLQQTFSAYDPAGDPGGSAIGAIADEIGEVDRVHPAADRGVAWSGADYKAIFGGIAGFLREQQRGMPRFIEIVKGRTP